MKVHKFLFAAGAALALLLSADVSGYAQLPKAEILKDIVNTSGIYHVYPDFQGTAAVPCSHVAASDAYCSCAQGCNSGIQPTSATPAPDGYKPFYISHLGRHGSRWHSSATTYERPLKRLQQGSDEGKLTPLGKEVLALVKTLADDARDRYGELTPRGTREHRQIAERMYFSYPEVFTTENGRECNIEAYSSNVVRCVLSMAASNERLKELNPEIRITRSSSTREMNNIFARPECMKLYQELTDVKKNAFLTECDPTRLLESLFTDYQFIPENRRWQMQHDLHMLAAGCADVDYLGINLFQYLEPEEAFEVWKVKNMMMYFQSGPSPEYGSRAMSDAVPALNHIVTKADEALESGETAATLRYGHDQNLVPLVALMGLENCDIVNTDGREIYECWCDFVITPMAANLQLIFFRAGPADPILVKILLNEKETRINGLTPVHGIFYDWTALRHHLLTKIHSYE